MFTKKLKVVLITAVLLMQGISAASAEQFLLNQTPDRADNESRVTITESSEGGSRNSTRQVSIRATGDQYLCKEGFSSGQCKLSNKKNFSAWTVLPVCKTSSAENCLEGFEALVDGIVYKPEFIKYAGGDSLAAFPEIGLYEGSQISLWKIPGLLNESGTDTFAVNVSTSSYYDFLVKRFVTTHLDVAIHAYKLVTNPGFEPPQTFTQIDPTTNESRVTLTGPSDCVWSDKGECGREVEFPSGVRFEIASRVSTDISGWFRGRLKDPMISVEAFNKTNLRVKVSAEPVTVPRFSVVVTEEQTSGKTQSILSTYGGNGFGLFNGSHKHIFSSADQNPNPYLLIRELRGVANDTSAGTSNLWNFSTIGIDSNNKCLGGSSRLLGIVTTNATLFDGTAPSFTNGTLSYKLAGMHYLPDGKTEAVGSYDLVMRSDVARCLYKFNKAPVQASITISGEGDKNIATTVVGEKNGWLKLAAYGFTFSEKTIKVKLTQKKTTITCVTKKKPIKTKKVTGYSPKCPTGYKKK